MRTRRDQWLALIPLTLFSSLLAYPFLWMFFAGFKTNQEVFKPLQLMPETFSGEYYSSLFSGKWFDFWLVFFNSSLIAGLQAVGAVLITAMAGFVFARYTFRGKNILLVLALLTILIPRQVIALPLYAWLIKLELTNSLLGVMLPGMVTGIGVLFFIQVFKQIPEQFLEAARLEGASEFRLFWMILPLASSALLTYGLIHFILAWHEHLVPLLVLQSPEKQTLPLALSSLYGSSLRYPKAVIMAASTLSLLPNLLVFVVLYKRAQSALADLMCS
jgi:multiple sugar transport system permease protein